jgi:hypothetical protein
MTSSRKPLRLAPRFASFAVACALAAGLGATQAAADESPPAAATQRPPPEGVEEPSGGRALPRNSSGERLQVADPYIELRTGPGRGFPVFFVAPREQWIGIELRRTDWYRVRTEDGKIGWVHRQQLESTLTEAGSTKTFRDIVVDDYLKRRVQFGAAWGQFNSEPMLKIYGSAKLSDTLTFEATTGQVQGTFSGTDFWHLNLMAEPWSDQRASTFFALGMGRFRNIPNASLVSALTTDAKLSNASFGLRYYLTDRFILRADYSIYTAFVSDARSIEYRAATFGISFFF